MMVNDLEIFKSIINNDLHFSIFKDYVINLKNSKEIQPIVIDNGSGNKIMEIDNGNDDEINDDELMEHDNAGNNKEDNNNDKDDNNGREKIEKRYVHASDVRNFILSINEKMGKNEIEAIIKKFLNDVKDQLQIKNFQKPADKIVLFNIFSALVVFHPFLQEEQDVKNGVFFGYELRKKKILKSFANKTREDKKKKIFERDLPSENDSEINVSEN